VAAKVDFGESATAKETDEAVIPEELALVQWAIGHWLRSPYRSVHSYF
jgi:hypothetical protein